MKYQCEHPDCDARLVSV